MFGTRKATLWALGLASLALFAVLASINRDLQDLGKGIIEFELTGSVAGAQEIIRDWGAAGVDDARTSLWLDFPFLILYGAFWWLAARTIAERAGARGLDGLRRAASLAAPAAVAAAAFDAAEDVCLLLVLDGLEDGSPFPLLAAVFAAIKFLLLFAAILTVIVGALRLRRSA